LSFAFLLFVSGAAAQKQDFPPGHLKKMSLEELMSIEVTSLSRREAPLSEAASSIQVVTGEDIHRAGVTFLPEALRLTSNLQVAQYEPNQWAISARGFNDEATNKMLVLIDGRTIYSPLFAGVIWEQQDAFMEDIDRIEVISGPGATLWGSNAVNGIINIRTKSAAETHGWLVSGGGGNEVRGFGGLRYGGVIDSTVHFRVYGKYGRREEGVPLTGPDDVSSWRGGQGGFRVDWQKSTADQITLQGDLYDSRRTLTDSSDVVNTGGYVLGRWSHTFSENSDFKLQMYFDRSHRDVPGPAGSFDDRLHTFDVDFDHRLILKERHKIVWGAGFRSVHDNWIPRALLFLPQRVSLQTFSAFVQDEIKLITDRLHLTIGTKVEHNDYTGLEIQPSTNLAVKLSERHTLWGAISRAVRTPSRIDRHFVVEGLLIGGPGFQSEELLAYEIGYRAQPSERLSLSLATFYNDYDDLRSVEPVNPPDPLPVELANGQKGRTYGFEFNARYHINNRWQLRGGYTELRVDIEPKAGSADNSSGSRDSNDPKRYLSLHSHLVLPANLTLNAGFRYVSSITNPTAKAPAYAELDVRLAWQATPSLELSIVGQELLHNQHFEFGAPATRQQIERGFLGKVLWRF
jgi:iron complex outermembrane receptor protein